MLDNHVRLRSAKLVQGVVTGQHRAGMNPPVPRSLDVVLHVANEKRLIGYQAIFLEDLVDLFALVPNADVGLFEILVETRNRGLDGEMIRVDGAQKKGADPMGPAKLEKIAGVRQFDYRILDLLEAAMEPGLELRQSDMGHMAVVKEGERETELGTKLFEAHFGAVRLG